jgi:hypothetical protein
MDGTTKVVFWSQTRMARLQVFKHHCRNQTIFSMRRGPLTVTQSPLLQEQAPMEVHPQLQALMVPLFSSQQALVIH